MKPFYYLLVVLDQYAVCNVDYMPADDGGCSDSYWMIPGTYAEFA